jgi:hypothetical protein
MEPSVPNVTSSKLASVGSIAYHAPVNGPAALVVVVVDEVAGGVVFFVLASRPDLQEKPYFAYWLWW